MGAVKDLVSLNTLIRLHKESLDKYLTILDSYMGGQINREELRKIMGGIDMSKFTIGEDSKEGFFDWLVGEADLPERKVEEVKEEIKIEEPLSPLADALEINNAFFGSTEAIRKRATKADEEIDEEY